MVAVFKWGRKHWYTKKNVIDKLETILSTAYESGIKLTNLMVICIVCVGGGKSSYHLHVLNTDCLHWIWAVLI
jgi:hypothetical protein